MHDYSATFACYNNLEYTKQCLTSLQQSNFDMSKLTIIDNDSKDGTWDYLASLDQVKAIKNKSNLGCGVAWNQGILSLQSEWTVIMNNDVIVSENWIENLIDQAIENNLLVASPAMIEGDRNYDLATTLPDNERLFAQHYRKGCAHAVCLLVHESVWHKVGLFRATPKLLGFEDTIFFHDCMKNGIEHGMLGRSWIHHFGSVTVNLLKKEQGIKKRSGGLGDRNNKNLLDQGFFMRKFRKFKKRQAVRAYRESELQEFGKTIHYVMKDGVADWR